MLFAIGTAIAHRVPEPVQVEETQLIIGCDWLLDQVRANDKVIAVTAWVTEVPSETEKVSENVPSCAEFVLGVIVNTFAFAPVP